MNKTKIILPKKGSLVTDLLGRTFKVGKWDFAPIPLLGIPDKFWPCQTRDRISGIAFTLFFDPNEPNSNYIMQIYNNDLKIHVRYDLEFIEYNPKEDMRKLRI